MHGEQPVGFYHNAEHMQNWNLYLTEVVSQIRKPRHLIFFRQILNFWVTVQFSKILISAGEAALVWEVTQLNYNCKRTKVILNMFTTTGAACSELYTTIDSMVRPKLITCYYNLTLFQKTKPHHRLNILSQSILLNK